MVLHCRASGSKFIVTGQNVSTSLLFFYDDQINNSTTCDTGDEPGFPADFDLSLLPTLESFRLDIYFWDGILAPKSFQIFKMSGRCSIHNIVITMGWASFDPDHIFLPFLSDENWRSLDEIITSSRFPFLKKLSLKFCVEYQGDNPSKPNFNRVSTILSSEIHSCLPAISASDSFAFVVEIQRTGATAME